MLLKTPRRALLSPLLAHSASSPPFSLALRPSSRALTMTPHHPQAVDASNPTTEPAPDWSAAQYLKFGSERTRAVRDLVANIPLTAPGRIVDLGCGPGNSTAVLAARWPAARLSGVDASPDMLARARAAGLPGVDFSQADLRTWRWRAPDEGEEEGEAGAVVDLLFSNAVLHWLRRSERIPTVLRLLQQGGSDGGGGLRSGGVLAFQVPDNHEEPSHRAMREVAARPGTPWRGHFAALEEKGEEARPDLDPIETAGEWYDALIPACARVDVWHVLYQHALEGPGAIVEWVRGTGLMPFLNALPEGEVREAYVRAYEERLGEVYPRRADGRVLLRYPRLFVVATKK